MIRFMMRVDHLKIHSTVDSRSYQDMETADSPESGAALKLDDDSEFPPIDQ